MNSQNILKFYGSRLDLKLDHSEFYDYELGKTDLDYNSNVLDLTKQITYNTLKINTSLSGLSCSRNLILLNEFNNSINDSSYLYSGITLNLNYDNFISYFGSTYNDTILNNDIYTFTGITNEIHYFKIDEFNNSSLPLFSYNTDLLGDDIVIDEIFNSEDTIISGFTKQVIQCVNDLDNSLNCCPITPKLNSKPWAYKFNAGIGVGNCDPIISRRPEKGWTLDFIFNRESLDWDQGGVFYYLGVRGENNNRQYSDNNLSFQFTSDGKISWFAHHYSGFCGNDGYEEVFYLSSGITPLLCTIDEEKDFNVTIVFDRYKKYQDCDLENNGGWNDLIVSPTLNTSINEWLSGDTESYTYTEILNKKWADERQRRLGTLKIYLNGRPIYKIDDWEEVIPSERGRQPFIQSWGGGTGLMNNVHDGVSCFNIKSIKYYEEPLDFIHVRHNFLTRINQYDFDICGDECFDSVIGLIASTPTPTPTPTATPTPTPTPTIFIPENDLFYILIPNDDLTYTLIPSNDLIGTFIPDSDLLYTLIPNGDLNYVLLPDNDVNYTLIPNDDLTYTLVPNNDLSYLLLTPTPTETPTPTPTETPTPTPTPTSAPEGATLVIEVPQGSPSITFDGDTYDSTVTVDVIKNQQYDILANVSGGGFLYWEGDNVNLPAANSSFTIVTITGNTATLRAVFNIPTSTPTPTPTSTPTPTLTPTGIVSSNLVLHFDPSNVSSYPESGTTITDLSGNGLNGTMSNITYTSPSFNFNGTNSTISVPDNTILEPSTGDWTMEAWINHSVITGSSRIIFAKTDGGTAQDWGYGLRTSPLGLTFGEIGNGGTASLQSNNSTLATNVWYQVVAVWTNVVTNSFELFINGISQGSKSHSFTSVKDTASPLYIGSFNNGQFSQWFNGKIGITRIYNKVLTLSEVLQNFNTDKSKYGL
jgi:hypothetical protein